MFRLVVRISPTDVMAQRLPVVSITTINPIEGWKPDSAIQSVVTVGWTEPFLSIRKYKIRPDCGGKRETRPLPQDG